MEIKKIMQEKEAILTAAVLLVTTGGALIDKNFKAGVVCVLVGLSLFYLRYKFKSNGRWVEKKR